MSDSLLSLTRESEDPGAPRVSVIMIFLDAAEFISEAIESVLGQEYDSWELILVDDGSSDRSSEIALEYVNRNHRIRYCEHPGHLNKGMSAARNLGIQRARGMYIAFLDADDIWLPSKLRQQVKILDKSPGIALVAGSVLVRYQDNGSPERNADVLEETGHCQDQIIDPPNALVNLWPVGPYNPPIPSNILIARSAIAGVGGFEEEFRALGEDYVFLTKIYLHYPVYFASNTWTIYRMHDRSCTALILARGTSGKELEKVLRWIDSYVRTQPDVPRKVGRMLRLRMLALDHPWLNVSRKFVRILLPMPMRNGIRWFLRRSQMLFLRIKHQPRKASGTE